MKKGDDPIKLEFILNASSREVWSAITNAEEMRRWFFDNIPAFKAEKGFTTEFEVFSGERKFTHQWEILEVIPGSKLIYGWKYLEYKGDSTIEFLIREHKEGFVKVFLQVDILEDFDSDVPEFKRESCIGGWRYFIGGTLSKYLLLEKEQCRG